MRDEPVSKRTRLSIARASDSQLKSAPAAASPAPASPAAAPAVLYREYDDEYRDYEQHSSPGAVADDVLAKIFSLLEARDLRAASAVCRRWRAVACSPDLNPMLTLWVVADVQQWQDEEVQRAAARRSGGWPTPRGCQPPAYLGIRPLSVQEAIALVQAPRFAGLRCLYLYASSLVPRPTKSTPELTLWRVMRAAPPSLQTLVVHVKTYTILRSLRLAESAPGLRDLFIGGVDECSTNHLAIERLGTHMKDLLSGEGQDARALVAALPALRRIRSAVLDAASTGVLAAGGVSCQSVHIRRAARPGFLSDPALVMDLADPAALTSLLTVHRPLEYGALPAAVDRFRAELFLLKCRLPLEWPVGALQGVRSLKLERCRLTPDVLRALREAAFIQGVKKLEIWGWSTDLVLFSPGDLVALLSVLRRGAHASLFLPDKWGEYPALLDALAASPQLLRDVDIFCNVWSGKPGPLVEAHQRFQAAQRQARGR
eukprot:tig00021352_g20680.t1